MALSFCKTTLSFSKTALLFSKTALSFSKIALALIKIALSFPKSSQCDKACPAKPPIPAHVAELTSGKSQWSKFVCMKYLAADLYLRVASSASPAAHFSFVSTANETILDGCRTQGNKCFPATHADAD